MHNTPGIREFRINEELSVAVGTRLIYKFVLNTNTLLTSSSIEIDQGGLRYSVWSAQQAVETLPFETTVTVYRKNLLNPPLHLPENRIFKGGAANFSGVANTISRVRTSGNSGRSSIVGESTSVRAFPQTVTYVEIMPLDGINQTSTGVWNLEFEEIGR